MLADTGFSAWQVLPLGEPQVGFSPYQCTSAFAFNPLLLLEYPPVDTADNGFAGFCKVQQYWLDDYVLFKVLKRHFGDKGWNQWPEPWRSREPQSLQQTCEQYADDIEHLKWQQYQLHKRWQEIRLQAADREILLFGDMPIYIAFDSADVWAHPDCFILDKDGNMKVVTGVPPDYFSETGQRWGNPHYDWDEMRKDGFAWWKSRIHHHLELFDLIRIDHFRGLEAAWVIDAACETAVEGHWLKMPGDELMSAIKAGLGEHGDQLPFVAEDLGVITPEVTALRVKYNLPGMSVLQFGFDEFDDNPHKPQNITENTVVYTGTHDNDTTKGWFNSLDDDVKKYVLRTLDISDSDDQVMVGQEADLVVDKLIENAMSSPAHLCIIPLQDYLHLGTDTRMNTPGTTDGNWTWRFQWQQIEQQHNARRQQTMRMLAIDTKRLVSAESLSATERVVEK